MNVELSIVASFFCKYTCETAKMQTCLVPSRRGTPWLGGTDILAFQFKHVEKSSHWKMFEKALNMCYIPIRITSFFEDFRSPVAQLVEHLAVHEARSARSMKRGGDGWRSPTVIVNFMQS